MSKQGNKNSLKSDYYNDKIKTCANCRWFEVLGEGYEIARIEDLRYMHSRCRLLKWETREHYLFRSPAPGDEIKRPAECPFWEPVDS